MAALLLTVAIDWYGPTRTLEKARQLGIQNKVGEVIYIGYQVGTGRKSYVGLSSHIANRIRSSHHIFGDWGTSPAEYWLGLISSQSEPGRKPSDSPAYHSAALHFAEHMIAYFIGTSENSRKNMSPPKRSGLVFNRWFHQDKPWLRHKHRPHENWPDLIEYEITESFGRNVYFGGRIEKFDV